MAADPQVPESSIVRVPRSAVPARGCVAAGTDAEVLLVDTGERVAAYRNRCLHVGRPLDRGVVRDGVLTCPHHLWRYVVSDGRCVAGGAAAQGRGLVALPLVERGGVVEVRVPSEPMVGMREQLLTHARTWRRES